MIRRWRGRVALAMIAAAWAFASVSADDSSHRGALIEIGKPPRIPSALDSVPHPWPGRALLLSAVGTAVPIAIATRPHPHSESRNDFLAILGAEIVTPAAGHLYAGLGRRAAAGMVARGLGFGIAAAALPSESSGDITYGALAAVMGMVIVGTSALIDVVTVSPDVERKNQAWLAAHSAVGVRTVDDGRTPAVTLVVRF
ncbi:MAG TPA: hypothetical protein VL123_02845 [Candidatus Udaeobacter sp.]|jgi:hypothetical protein|nr:hypothetical protein [Candidatus Udaeobacter sp.]